MSDKDSDDGSGTIQANLPQSKQMSLFGSSGIQLSDGELAQSSTMKFLRHLNDEKEGVIQKLRSFESQFYDKRQECEVLKKEKEGINPELISKKTLENVQKVTITAGSLILGSLKFFDGAEWLCCTN